MKKSIDGRITYERDGMERLAARFWEGDAERLKTLKSEYGFDVDSKGCVIHEYLRYFSPDEEYMLSFQVFDYGYLLKIALYRQGALIDSMSLSFYTTGCPLESGVESV